MIQTFYTLLWKTRLFINDGFKPTAIFKVFRFEMKYLTFVNEKLSATPITKTPIVLLFIRPLGLIVENPNNTGR